MKWLQAAAGQGVARSAYTLGKMYAYGLGTPVDLAKSMKSGPLAAILSSMQPKRAETLTRLLANLSKPPANLTTPTPTAAPASPLASPA